MDKSVSVSLLIALAFVTGRFSAVAFWPTRAWVEVLVFALLWVLVRAIIETPSPIKVEKEREPATQEVESVG